MRNPFVRTRRARGGRCVVGPVRPAVDVEALEHRALLAATPIALGQTVAGEISAPGETDEYTFSVGTGKRIYFDVQKATGVFATLYLDFKLFKVVPGQAPVRVFFTSAYANQPDIADRDVQPLDAGDYLLTVDARQDDLSTYEFKVWDVPPPDVRTINIGDEVAGAIEAPGNTDEYLFTAAPGQRIFLDVLETTGNFSSLYLNFTLVPVPQPAGSLPIFKSTAYATQPNHGDYGPVTLAGGNYKLTVDALDQDTSTYRFKLIDIPPIDTNPLAFGAVKTGAIESAGALDEWTFSVAGGERAYLDVQEITGNRATLYLDFRLTQEGATPVEKLKTTGFVNQPDLADRGPVALDAGNYKLTVSARGMDTAGYKFILRRELDMTALGTAWTAPFVQALHDAGLGDGGYDNYPLDLTKTLPWGNINAANAQLATGMTLAAGDVVIRGTYGEPVSPSEFTYDPATGLATWRLAAPLAADNHIIDVGTMYRTRLRVLPGDGNRDGRVNALDLAVVKQRLNRTIQSPGSGNGAYGVFADGNGDGRINALDASVVKANLNRIVSTSSLPAAVGGEPPRITSDVLGLEE